MSEICPFWKNANAGNMPMSEILYVYALVGNMYIKKMTVKKTVVGKKLRRHLNNVLQ